MSTNFQIVPVTIPDAAALNVADGDVRHFSTSDGMDAISISNPTRQLAYRDVLLADKLNEVVSVVNNKEQLISLPIIRITLPPGTEEIVANQFIPPGFEARILNAAISSNPTGIGRLRVFHSASTYGAAAGTGIFDTSNTSASDTEFFGTGEFIIHLSNIGGLPAELAANIILTLRPVGTQSGGIIGPGAVGGPGQKGERGIIGPKGLIGPAGLTGKSFFWRGEWLKNLDGSPNPGVTYLPNDVIRYTDSSGLTSAYIALVAITDTTTQIPPLGSVGQNAFWSLVAEGGATGLPGSPGTGTPGVDGADGVNPKGAWVMGSYNKGDLVTYGGSTYIAITSVTAAITNPLANPAYWMHLFDNVPSFSTNPLTASLTDGGGFTAGAGNAEYVALTLPDAVTFGMVETINKNASSSPQGIILISGVLRTAFTGTLRVTLPTSSEASVSWAHGNVRITASAHGIALPSTTAATVLVNTVGLAFNEYDVTCYTANTFVEIAFNGSSII